MVILVLDACLALIVDGWKQHMNEKLKSSYIQIPAYSCFGYWIFWVFLSTKRYINGMKYKYNKWGRIPLQRKLLKHFQLANRDAWL